MKRSYLAFAAASALMLSCSPEKTEENTQEETTISDASTEEWVSLFDGQTFEGWSKYGGGEVGNAWKIEDGSI